MTVALKMEVPQAARAALAWARTFHPDAFIAGGYLRDVYFGNQPKDIDVFTFAPDIREGGKTILEHAADVDEFAHVYEGERVTDAEVAVDVEGCDVPVQIVHLNPEVADTPLAAVEQFMVGLSQLWYDGVSVFATDQFTNDAVLKRITVTYAETRAEMQRLLRKIGSSLVPKYPTYTVVIPPTFSSLLTEERELLF